MRLSKHFTLTEATKSQTAIRKGIDNQPSDSELLNLKFLANEILEPIREMVSYERGKDTPLYISSWFRNIQLNDEIGGSKTSDHVFGLAVDIDLDGRYLDFTNADLYRLIKESDLVFDQLIWEFGTKDNPAWVHISKRRNANRKMAFRIK